MLVLLTRIALAVVLALVVDNVDANQQRIVYVNEPFIDNGDTVTNSGDGSSGDVTSPLCCVYGNCSCYSFDDALDSLTSNVLLNITIDVMLSSLINASNLKNISIIGHNNPIVNCKGVGGIHFTFCNNCIIRGIIWDGCGAGSSDNTAQALKLKYSSNITILNCSFQHSKGQAVVLSDCTGDVNINHCRFVNNSHYRGHGAAISYSSNNIIIYPIPFLFQICNCNFTYNEGSESLVHIENNMTEINSITLCNSIFYHNQGVSIYVVNQELYLNGNNSLENNMANSGAGIYSNHSTVIFGRNSYATFIQNSAHNSGGAIYSNNGNIYFKDNSTTMFINNIAYKGGAIHSSYGSTISFEDNSTTLFSNNNAGYSGGAILIGVARVWVVHKYSGLSFKDNSTTVFNNNSAINEGGAVYQGDGNIYFEDNSFTMFSNNNAIDGGAIFLGGGLFYNRTLSFEDYSITMFINNNGGAIHSTGGHGSISFEDNSNTMFRNNNASEGAAVHSGFSSISFKDNSTTVFDNNNNAIEGGAVYQSGYVGSISFKDNSTTVFSNNNASISGGALLIGGAACRWFYILSFEDNSTTVFSNNNAVDGGAVYGRCSSICCKDNSTTMFSNNSAKRGGAIYSDYGSTTRYM